MVGEICEGVGFFPLDVWRGIYVNMLVSYAQNVWVCGGGVGVRLVAELLGTSE